MEHREDGLIVERDRIDIRLRTRVSFDEFESALDRRQIAQTKEVHLEKTQRLDAVHLILRHDLGVGAFALDRNNVRERYWRDHDRCGMDRVLPP